jgi:outer membrane protein
MKNIINTLFIIVFVLSGLTLKAQDKLKIGYINSQELLSAMPESDSAQKNIEKLAAEHQSLLEEMTVEFNKKYDEYSKKMSTYSELAKASKEAELQDMQNRIQTFEQTAQQDIQQKRIELFKPIQDKALKAVSAVAEENGFTYILDKGTGAIVYESSDAQDILPLVKKKLGLQ